MRAYVCHFDTPGLRDSLKENSIYTLMDSLSIFKMKHLAPGDICLSREIKRLDESSQQTVTFTVKSSESIQFLFGAVHEAASVQKLNSSDKVLLPSLMESSRQAENS